MASWARRRAAAACSARSTAPASCGTPIGSIELWRTQFSRSVALCRRCIATDTWPVGSSADVARSWAPSCCSSDIALQPRAVGLRLLDREQRGAEALLELLVGLGEGGVRGADRVVGAAVEGRGQALLRLAQL